MIMFWIYELTMVQSGGDVSNEGRNPDGTFTKGSEAAKEAGAKGGSK